MRKTGRIQKFADLVNEHFVSPDRYIAWFVDHPYFDYQNAFTLDQYVEHWKQIFVNDSIANIAEQYSWLRVKDAASPRDLERKGNYIYHYDKVRRLFVYTINPGKLNPKTKKPFHRAVYNRVITIGGVPVVVDIKNVPWSGYGVNKSRGYGHGMKVRCINRFLEQSNVNKKSRPIQSYYGCDVGYLVIIPQDVYVQRENRSVFQGFLDRGGTLVHTNRSRLQFREDVRKTVTEFQLKLNKKRKAV